MRLIWSLWIVWHFSWLVLHSSMIISASIHLLVVILCIAILSVAIRCVGRLLSLSRSTIKLDLFVYRSRRRSRSVKEDLIEHVDGRDANGDQKQRQWQTHVDLFGHGLFVFRSNWENREIGLANYRLALKILPITFCGCVVVLVVLIVVTLVGRVGKNPLSR